MSDQRELVERLKTKDPDALHEVMKLYGTDVYRFTYLLLKDAHLSEDISQETFLRAYQKAGQCNGDGSLKNWLIKIALNLARKQVRLSYVRKFFPKVIEENELVDHRKRPEQNILSISLTEKIHQLPLKYREVILLYYYLDLSIKEISLLQNEHEGTIKSKLSRARNLLKVKLESEGWSLESLES